MACLNTRRPGSGDTRVSLDAVTVIGSDESCDFSCVADGILRQHARIERDDDGFVVRAAADGAALLVNGRTVSSARLQHLDVVSLGPAIDFVFTAHDAEAVDRRATQPAITAAALRWTEGPAAGTATDLRAGQMLVGRAPSSDILLDTPAVSRTHARLVLTGQGLTIEDAGSANGTSVNGVPVTRPVSLVAGDVVNVGRSCTARVEIIGAKAEAHVRPTSPGDRSPALGRDDLAEDDPEPRTVLDLEWQARLLWSDRSPSEGAEPPPAVPSDDEPGTSLDASGMAVEPPAIATVGAESHGPRERTSPDDPGTMFQKPEPISPPELAEESGDSAGGGDVRSKREKPAQIASARLVGDLGRFEIAHGTWAVGRDAGAHVHLPDRTVSRRHARLTLSAEALVLEHLGGDNGTYLNGKRVQERSVLSDGDLVAFAEAAFTVEIQRVGETG